jgi:superfamily II DNA helicase RecQ
MEISTFRSSVHKKWLDGSYQAVIATIAFGMGIDKPGIVQFKKYIITKAK